MIKVAWLCHFSNEEIRGLYPHDTKRPLYHLARKILRLPRRSGTAADFAGWVTGAIEEIKKRDDIELHVISPQTDIKGKICEFISEGIHYYFFNPNWTLFLMHSVRDNKRWRKWQNSSKYVNKFINKIRPDIIELVGSENPYYSCTVLDLEYKAPVLIALQTVYSNPVRLKYNPTADRSKNWYIDNLILSNFKYYALSAKMHSDLLRERNAGAITLTHSFCQPPLPDVKPLTKKFDFVNFAQTHGSSKGTTDSLEALAIVRRTYQNVTLNIVGGVLSCEVEPINNLIEKLGLQDNVVFTPYFKKQEDMFQHLQKSKYALLPVKLDVIPTSMTQAMYYGLPVVTYKTTGTPYLNRERECVLIADMENVQQLANNMLLLMNNPDKCEELRKNARQEAINRMDSTKIITRLVDNYKAIFENYHHGTPIPKKLIYSGDKIGIGL